MQRQFTCDDVRAAARAFQFTAPECWRVQGMEIVGTGYFTDWSQNPLLTDVLRAWEGMGEIAPEGAVSVDRLAEIWGLMAFAAGYPDVRQNGEADPPYIQEALL